ncbi:uncharacterized protein [Amphiura filiformis]|uniref:uncharacterized protein isoform X2 n=1 Tax=Amphiura filiformis TaxID=82378 RepID=UPI003B21E4B7
MEKRKLSSLVKKSDDTGTLDMSVDDAVEVPIHDDVGDGVNTAELSSDGDDYSNYDDKFEPDADGDDEGKMKDGIHTPELSSDGDNNDYDDKFEPDDGVEEEMKEKQGKDKPLIHTVNKTLLAPDVLEILGNANEQAEGIVPQCKFCERSFTTVYNLLNHVADKHKEVKKITEPYQCPTCQLRFLRARAVKRHLETKHKPVHTCEICNKSSTQANFLERHAKTHERKATKPLFQCPELYCMVQCKAKKDLMEHQMIHTGVRPYVCEICGKGFIRPSQLKAHKRIHTEDYIYCNLCDTFRTTTNSILQSHIKKKHSNKPEERKPILKNHMCELCGVCCATNAALTYHRMAVHIKEKLYSCDQCDYVTSHKSSVRSHINSIHEKLKPHKCQFCEKSFANRRARDIHQRIHTGEKPYKCQFCEKSFAVPTTRNDHQRIHTGEKPYTCELCGKAFCSSDSLWRHRKGHVADFEFQCDVCKYKTISFQSLKQHKEKKHSGETLTCTKCNMSFSTAQTLNAHNKEHKDGVEYVAKKER